MEKKLEILIKTATKVYNKAYAPYSNFQVGSAIIDEHGNIHSGCNVENAAYPSGSCAEEQAIGSMIANGGRVIKQMVVIGKSQELITPCGACRQRIREFCDKETLIHICDVERGYLKSFKLQDLLSYSFGPENL